MIYTFETADKDEAEALLRATDSAAIVHEIWERCFRPNRKQSYNNKLLNKDSSFEIIEAIAEIYQEVIND